MINFDGLLDYQGPHLKNLLTVLKYNSAALDASDTGVGKTYTACAVARELKTVPFLIAPKVAIPTWERVAKHIGIDMEAVNYEKVRGRRGDDGLTHTEWIDEFKHGQGSYLKWKNPYSLIIFDEVHNCGGSTTLNSKLLIASKRQHKNILALSATAADDPTQFKALGFALGLHDLKKYMNFLLAHGVTPGVFGGWSFTTNVDEQRKAMAKIHARVFPRRGARLLKKNIPGFPRETLDIKLLPKPSAALERMAEELPSLNPSDLAAIQVLRQALESAKVPDACALAREYAMTSKVAIFVNYHETVRQMIKGLVAQGFELGRIGWITGDDFRPGTVNHFPTRDSTVDAFQRNKIDVLIVTHGAGGASISLHDPYEQYDRTGLHFPTFSGKHLKQASGRLPRSGGGFVQQFLLYFQGTYEEKVAKILLGKLGNIDTLNDGLLDQILTGRT